MNADAKQIIALFSAAIILYLLLKNPDGTAKLVTALGGTINTSAKTLQGR